MNRKECPEIGYVDNFLIRRKGVGVLFVYSYFINLNSMEIFYSSGNVLNRKNRKCEMDIMECIDE